MHNFAGSAAAITNRTPTKTNFMVSSDVFNALNKNAVSALNELCQKNGCTVLFKRVSENLYDQKNKFTVAAVVNGTMYESVTASNMKDAKREAADVALKVNVLLYKYYQLLLSAIITPFYSQIDFQNYKGMKNYCFIF